MFLRKTAALFAAALGLLMTTTTADAAFSLRISVDGLLIAQIDDGGVGDQDGALNGNIFVSEFLPGGVVIPDFNVDIEFAESSSPDGNPAILSQLTNLDRTGDGTGMIEFFASATDYVAALLSNTLSSDVTNNEVLGSGESVEFQSWADDGNVQFAIAGETSPGPQVLTGALELDSASTDFSASGTFSVSNRLRVTLNSGTETQITADTNVNPVPEPGTMALLALGGVGLAGARWRRRKTT